MALILSALLGIALVIIENPLFFELIRRILSKGLIEGALLSLGGFLAYFGILVGLFFGAYDILKLDSIRFLLFLIGGIVLLGIGIDTLRMKEDEIYAPKDKKGVKGHPILVGFGLTISNPFDLALWISVSISYLTSSSKVFGFVNVLFLALGIILVFFGLASLIYLTRKRVSNHRILIASRVFSCVLIGYSAYFFLQFFRMLLFYPA